MRWLGLYAVLALSSSLGGCATEVGPSTAELKARWEAENTYPEAYKRDLLAFLRTYLNDPEHVRAAAVSKPQRKRVGPGERYVACVRYQARTAEGKYSPPKQGAATYVSGKLDRFFDNAVEMRELCNDAVLEPFPELEKLRR